MLINNLATILNEFIVSLYSKNIHYYQIILGLIIFNFIIYLICKIIKISKTIRFN